MTHIPEDTTNDQVNALNELMMREEALDPELEIYVVDAGPFGPMLKHPLVFEMLMVEGHHALTNERFRQKRKATQEAYAKKEWSHYIYLHERAYRLDAFRACCWQMDGPEYWGHLGSVWVDSENIYQNRDEWREMYEADCDGRLEMMSEEDRLAFTLPPEQGGFPPTFPIYRGFCYDDAQHGMSWTLDKARGKWFASRLHQEGQPQPRVARGMVAAGDVLAYHTGRDEQEIVVFPENVKDVEVTWVKP
jgi:hypothetical protein